MKKRGLIFLGMVACILLVLAGCGKSGEGQTDQTEKDAEKTVTADAERWKDVFTLGQYEGITLPKLSEAVSEAEIQKEIQNILDAYGATELTDAFVAENLGMETAGQYYAKIKSDLEAQKQTNNNEELYQRAYAIILKNSSIDHLPVEEEERIINDTLAVYEQEADEAGKELWAYVLETMGLEREAFLEGVKNLADDAIKEVMVWDSVADAAGISFTQSEYDDYAFMIVKQTGFDTVAEFEAQNGTGALKNEVFRNAAVDYVVQHAVFEEEEKAEAEE